jgi:hypothetical protein
MYNERELRGGFALEMSTSHEQILEQVQRALVDSAGFAPEAVLRNYAYADYLGDSQEVRQVDLAAFAETPPSYRSACVALARFDQDNLYSPTLDPLRALGAPRVIALGPRRASLWGFYAGLPEKLEDFPRGEIASIIHTRAVEWSPTAILRASQVAEPGPYQLDFADMGLVPLIERQVNEKLDRLIREVLAGSRERDRSLSDRRAFPRLVRLVFWLLAAKVLADKAHPSLQESPSTAQEALELARRHYGPVGAGVTEKEPQSRLIPLPVMEWVWESIHSSLHFQNLSVDTLAFVYENTLVSPEVRQRLGIHGTPRAIAELVVRLLPLEDLPKGRDIILEPCAGFGPFLLAALRRLRSTALLGLDPEERHQLLIERLRGVELDPFALEVGRLCLTLADYPSCDGWQLRNEDVFDPGVLERACSSVGAVMANPPFEAFDPVERKRYAAVRAEKPAELLRRILTICSPLQLGMVLPRVLPESDRSGYREIRETLRRDFREIDRVDLPDNLFEHSGAESVLLIARSRNRGDYMTLRSARVRATQVPEVLAGRWNPEWAAAKTKSTEDGSAGPLRIDYLAEVWESLEHYKTLGEVAEIHRGIEYNRSFREAEDELVSGTPRPGMALGVRSARDLQPYQILRRNFLATAPEKIRASGSYAWSEPKVIMNAARRRRGPWCLTAAPDLEGRWCYQRLFGVWPLDPEAWQIQLLAAALNGPIAAAFTAERAGKRDIQKATLAAIPLPDPSRLDISTIIALVHRAMEELDVATVLRIDAEILRGYNLPPRLERHLLLHFDDQDRPGIPAFRSYYPSGFDSALPLHRVLTDLTDAHRANKLLTVVPVFQDRRVSEMFEHLAAGYGE